MCTNGSLVLSAIPIFFAKQQSWRIRKVTPFSDRPEYPDRTFCELKIASSLMGTHRLDVSHLSEQRTVWSLVIINFWWDCNAPRASTYLIVTHFSKNQEQRHWDSVDKKGVRYRWGEKRKMKKQSVGLSFLAWLPFSFYKIKKACAGQIQRKIYLSAVIKLDSFESVYVEWCRLSDKLVILKPFSICKTNFLKTFEHFDKLIWSIHSSQLSSIVLKFQTYM